MAIDANIQRSAVPMNDSANETDASGKGVPVGSTNVSASSSSTADKVLADKASIQLSSGIALPGGLIQEPEVKSSAKEVTTEAAGIIKKQEEAGDLGMGFNQLLAFLLSLLAKVMTQMREMVTSSQKARYQSAQAAYSQGMAAAEQVKSQAHTALVAGAVGGALSLASLGVSAGFGVAGVKASKQGYESKVEAHKLGDPTSATEGLAAINPQGVGGANGQGEISSVNVKQMKESLNITADGHKMKSDQHQMVSEGARQGGQVASSMSTSMGESDQKKAEAEKQQNEAARELWRMNESDSEDRRTNMRQLFGQAIQLAQTLSDSERQRGSATRSAS